MGKIPNENFQLIKSVLDNDPWWRTGGFEVALPELVGNGSLNGFRLFTIIVTIRFSERHAQMTNIFIPNVFGLLSSNSVYV